MQEAGKLKENKGERPSRITIRNIHNSEYKILNQSKISKLPACAILKVLK